MNSPCYECQKRCMLCHAHCTEYAEWAEKMRNRPKRPKSEIETDILRIDQQKRIRRLQQARWQEMNRK